MFNTSRIELERHGSLKLSLLLLAGYLIAVSGLYFSALALSIKCALTAVLAWDAFRIISLHATLTSATATTKFLYYQGKCVLFRRDGAEFKASFLEAKRLSRGLISISVAETEGNKRRHLLIASDGVTPESFHQLCLMIRLRTGFD